MGAIIAKGTEPSRVSAMVKKRIFAFVEGFVADGTDFVEADNLRGGFQSMDRLAVVFPSDVVFERDNSNFLESVLMWGFFFTYCWISKGCF